MKIPHETTVSHAALGRRLREDAKSYLTLHVEAHERAQLAKAYGGACWTINGVTESAYGPFSADYERQSSREWWGCWWAVTALLADLDGLDTREVDAWCERQVDRDEIRAEVQRTTFATKEEAELVARQLMAVRA